MLSKGQADVIKSIVDYINTNYKNATIPKVLFDELSTSKDSICITTAEDTTPSEKMADVCGGWLRGVVDISLTYRKMLLDKGNKDLEVIKQLDDIYDFIRKNYKSIETDDCFIEQVTQKSGAKLDAVYQGGVKDFKGIISIVYERRD